MLFHILLLLQITAIGNGAKIGVFTAAFSNSQMVFNMRIAESLAEAGHKVVIIRPEYNPLSTSLKSKNPKIREIHVKAAPLSVFKEYDTIIQKEIYEGHDLAGYISFSNAYKKLILAACKNMLDNDEFIQKIKEEKIELAFHHHIDFCQHGIAHHLGIKKWVLMLPGPTHSLILTDVGIPFFDVYMPNMLQNTTTDMSFLERTKSVIGNILFNIIGPIQIDNPTTELMRKKFGKDFPHISELRKTAALVFVNNDPFLEYPFPHTQKIQFIGGIGTQAPRPLKEPLASFAENAKRIVLISFGSVVVAKDMPQSWRTALLELFRQNPDISFIWKFEEEIEVPTNVLRTKWLPQNDILTLNKTVAFITHGGYNSLGEAVQSGTPCVFIPLFADQFRNSMLAQYRGIGLQLSKKDLSFDNLNSKLQEILKNPKYVENIRKYQALAQGRLNTPDEILRHWTNLILNHELEISLPVLPKYQLYNLDVYLLFFSIILIFFLIVRTIFRWYYWSCCEMAYKEKEKIQ